MVASWRLSRRSAGLRQRPPASRWSRMPSRTTYRGTSQVLFQVEAGRKERRSLISNTSLERASRVAALRDGDRDSRPGHARLVSSGLSGWRATSWMQVGSRRLLCGAKWLLAGRHTDRRFIPSFQPRPSPGLGPSMVIHGPVLSSDLLWYLPLVRATAVSAWRPLALRPLARAAMLL